MKFQKGQSGNPGGRPKGNHSRTALMMELKEAGEDMPELRKIWRNVIDLAVNDKCLTATNMIWDRIDGKPPQAILHGEDAENPPQAKDLSEFYAQLGTLHASDQQDREQELMRAYEAGKTNKPFPETLNGNESRAQTLARPGNGTDPDASTER